MKVLIDGKEVQVLNDIKVIYDGVCVDMDFDTGDEEHAELHVTLTNEGLILDLIDEDGEVIGTYGTEHGEMATLCH